MNPSTGLKRRLGGGGGGDTARSAGTGTANSTGLGLAIVQALVEANGGRISVTREPGRTQYRVDLPMTRGTPSGSFHSTVTSGAKSTHRVRP